MMSAAISMLIKMRHYVCGQIYNLGGENFYTRGIILFILKCFIAEGKKF
jgi:hypothetical protein